MKFSYFNFLLFLIAILFCVKFIEIFAQDEILPIGQIRDIGAESSVQPQIETAREKVERATGTETAKEIKQESKNGTETNGVLGQTQAPKIDFLPKLLKRRFDFNLQGYVAAEAMYDSRQVIGFKFNEYTLFPAPQKLDKTGLDINDKSQFNMMAVRGTLTAMIKGPDIWNSKPTALIEGDFTGINDSTVGLFRLKKAFANLEWENSSLMLGQYYHPLCLDELWPETISFGRGIIYDPFRYAPQIKFRHRFDRYEFVTALSKRFDSEAARRSAMPDLFGEFYAHIDKHLIGLGINYHSEVPRLSTDVTLTSRQLDTNTTQPTTKTFKTTESLSSIYPFAFAAVKFNPFDIRMRLTYAENGNVYSLIGNYDVIERNARTDQQIYVNMKTLAFWTDIIYNRLSRFEPAVFVGVSKNLGTGQNIVKGYANNLDEFITDPDFLTLLQVDNSTAGIDYTFICAPRLRVKFGDLHLCAELEYTRASFAKSTSEDGWEKDFGPTGKVVCGKPVNNVRLLFATFYNFEYSPFSRESDYYDTHPITK